LREKEIMVGMASDQHQGKHLLQVPLMGFVTRGP